MLFHRNFKTVVDPTGLPVGAHHAEILAYDTSGDNGSDDVPVFRIPICVLKPATVPTP
eukprot:SAG31_NODE_25216_length_466_cov_0.498638_1_plen_57_part_01